MKDYLKILFSILAAAICTVSFAADQPSCLKTGKNCPMNDGKRAIAERVALANKPRLAFEFGALTTSKSEFANELRPATTRRWLRLSS